VILVVGELVPKTMGSRAPDRWALRLVRPVKFLKELKGPLRRVAQRISLAVFQVIVPKAWQQEAPVTDDDFQELLEMACQQGGLGRAERDLIQQIIRLDRRTAQDVMKPRAQMACVGDDLPVEEMVIAARKFKHRRLPIYDEKLDTIVGILNTRSLLLDPEADLSEAVEFPSFVPESMNLLQLFRSFQRQRRGIGIVLDEYGGTAGLVTTEDILEEVVGEIHGEAEAEGFMLEKLGEGRWRANGTARIEEFRREYPDIGEVRGVDTLGGLIVTTLGVVPVQGQSVVFKGLRLTAMLVDERRVREVLVETLKKRGGA
jgi:putative hemolysin